MHIGYVPYSIDLSHPADRRRVVFFVNYFNYKLSIADFNRSYDIVILSEKADLTKWIKYKKSKIIFDLCDSYLLTNYFNYKNLLKGYIGFLLGISSKPYFNYKSLIRKFCKNNASTVICSSYEQMKSIFPINSNVFNINDSHTSEIFEKKDSNDSKNFNIFWEGMGVSINNLKILKNINKSLSRKSSFQIVTDKYFFKFYNKFFKKDSMTEIENLNFDYNFYEWNYKNLNIVSRKCQIAIIPLNKNDMNRGRSLNKLLLLNKLGLVTLCSNINSYRIYLEKNDMKYLLFNNKSELIEKINYLSKNAEKLFEYKSKLKRALIPFSDKNTAIKWLSALHSCKYD